jgi:hypothetical protein
MAICKNELIHFFIFPFFWRNAIFYSGPIFMGYFFVTRCFLLELYFFGFVRLPYSTNSVKLHFLFNVCSYLFFFFLLLLLFKSPKIKNLSKGFFHRERIATRMRHNIGVVKLSEFKISL